MIARMQWFLIVLAAHQAVAAGAIVETMRVPEGGLQPQIVAAETTVHLLYYKGDPAAGDLFYVRSDDDGKTFGTPVRVNSGEGSAVAIGTIRGGQIAVGRQGRLHVAWNGSRKATEGSFPMLYTRSDGKGGFEPERNLMTAGFGLDGGGSVAADDAGQVYVAWHACPIKGGGELKRRVFVARSQDDGASFSRETPAWEESTGACGCCQLKAWAHGGKVRLLYRSCTTMNDRDTFLLASDDAGATFHGGRIHPWSINFCPMASYAFSPDGSWAAWETERRVFWAAVDDSGRSDAIAAAPNMGENQKHPVLATNKRGEVVLAWTEGTAWARGGKVQWQVYDAERRPLVRGERDGLPAWSKVAVFARTDGSFVVVY
jgi:hypothetical protein